MERRNVFKLLGVLLLAPMIIIPKKVVPKLTKVPWKLESVPELISCHGMDAEEELTKMMAEEIRKEIDEEILKKYNRPINKDFYGKIHIKANEIYTKQGSQKTNFLVISDENYERLQ
jgi:hypothetical protein